MIDNRQTFEELSRQSKRNIIAWFVFAVVVAAGWIYLA